MSYYKVVYDKLFPYAPYLNERIGIEILVETSQDPLEALEEARKIVHDFRNKHIQAELSHQYEPIPNIQVERQEMDEALTGIGYSQSIADLEGYKILAKNKPVLQAAYDVKYKQLLKKLNND
jgi:hypothetical protein